MRILNFPLRNNISLVEQTLQIQVLTEFLPKASFVEICTQKLCHSVWSHNLTLFWMYSCTPQSILFRMVARGSSNILFFVLQVDYGKRGLSNISLINFSWYSLFVFSWNIYCIFLEKENKAIFCIICIDLDQNLISYIFVTSSLLPAS